MLRLVMRATVIAVVLVVGYVLYLIYQEEQTPRWPTAGQLAQNAVPGSAPSPAQPAPSPLSPIPSAPNAGTVTPPGAVAVPTPGAAPATVAGQQAGGGAPTPAGQGQPGPADPLSAALQRLRDGSSPPPPAGTATPPVAGQMTVTAPTPGPAPGPAPGVLPGALPGAPTALAPSATPPGVAPPGAGGSIPPADQGSATALSPDQSQPGIPPGASALGGASPSGSLPAPIPLSPPTSGQAAGPAANLPNTTAAGTRWALLAGNGGMSLNIDLGGGQLAHVVVAPQFATLDRAGMDDRVNWLRQSILSSWGARAGTYIYRRDGRIFRTQ